MQYDPDLTAIIISYNTREMTLKCLEALQASLAGIPSEVIVVDNASGDGSPEAIRKAFPEVILIENHENRGFGAANNQAMQIARGEFFLLLNSDAFMEPDTASTLLSFIRTNPDAAVVGPRLLNEDGSLQVSCYRFPTPGLAWRENLWISSLFANHPALGDYRRWSHDHDRQVEWVVGACMLVRASVVERVGLFDESFFMYAEETDWQRRMSEASLQTWFSAQTQVVHLGGFSGKDEASSINQAFFESLDHYVLKHHGSLGLISLRCAMAVGAGLRAPLWIVSLLLRPSRRRLSAAKLRFTAWLWLRQVTNWRILKGRVEL